MTDKRKENMCCEGKDIGSFSQDQLIDAWKMHTTKSLELIEKGVADIETRERVTEELEQQSLIKRRLEEVHEIHFGLLDKESLADQCIVMHNLNLGRNN